MREEAIVITDKGDTVIVKIERKTACTKCEQKCGLALDESAEDMLVEINKTAQYRYPLKKGQKVILEIKENRVLFSALMVYIFPLLLMIGGYLFTNYLFKSEGAGIIGSLVFLALSFFILKIINRKLQQGKQFDPVMTGVID